MFAFNFGRKIRRVAQRQRRRGKLSNTDYQRILAASRDSKTVMVWKTTIEKEVPGAPWIQGNEDSIVSQIWAWLIENWAAILKILLSLLVSVEPSFQSEKDKLEDTELEDDHPLHLWRRRGNFQPCQIPIKEIE